MPGPALPTPAGTAALQPRRRLCPRKNGSFQKVKASGNIKSSPVAIANLVDTLRASEDQRLEFTFSWERDTDAADKDAEAARRFVVECARMLMPEFDAALKGRQKASPQRLFLVLDVWSTAHVVMTGLNATLNELDHDQLRPLLKELKANDRAVISIRSPGSYPPHDWQQLRMQLSNELTSMGAVTHHVVLLRSECHPDVRHTSFRVLEGVAQPDLEFETSNGVRSEFAV